jgi:hypothetical protein
MLNNKKRKAKQCSFTWEGLHLICRLASIPLDNQDQDTRSMQSVYRDNIGTSESPLTFL